MSSQFDKLGTSWCCQTNKPPPPPSCLNCISTTKRTPTNPQAKSKITHPLSHRKKRSVCVLIPPTLSPSAHLRGSQPVVALDAASVKSLPAPPTKLPAVQGSALTPPSRPSCSAQSGHAAARVSLGWTGSSSSVRHLEKPPPPHPRSESSRNKKDRTSTSSPTNKPTTASASLLLCN